VRGSDGKLKLLNEIPTMTRLATSLLTLVLLTFPAPAAAPVITPPKEHFGFNIGDDYCLANYKKLQTYWEKLAKESDRIKVVTIGKSEEGRDQLMAIVTSPANLKDLDRYRNIARRLAKADGISAEQAKQLADEGKAVVWIDGGLHASEILCAQVLIETVYQMLSANDPETLRILDDVILLFVHCNPDGMDLCADWYMRDKDPKKRSLGGLPVLYEKYAGHDNNRDFYAANLAETRNMNRVMYREWFPQIVYNHHQTGPAGAVMFIPPCRDPFNYNIHPMVINGIERVSAAMVERFLGEGKPGVTVRTGARYSTWFNGGLSTACQFHNMIGLFTETIGGPTPSNIPLITQKQLPNSDYLSPIPPQPWHFRQSVDYSVTANKAILDYASRSRSRLLHNIYVMGKHEIDEGNKDSWLITPKVVTAAKPANSSRPSDVNVSRPPDAPAGPPQDRGGFGARGGRGAGGPAEFAKLFHNPEKRAARGYILPADQPDFLTATKFVNTLINTGVTVQRATSDFTVGEKKYPAGSYVVKAAQAFRPHVFDMFEPQDHPDDFAPGSTTPTPPYDMAGWTLAYQMGVRFDRLVDGFDGPFEELKDEVAPPRAKVTVAQGDAGFLLDCRMNDAFRAVNRLMAGGEDVRRLTKALAANGTTFPPGTFFIVRKESTLPALEKLAAELGTPFTGANAMPNGEAVVLKPMRVALWDRYGGSMPAGWTRHILERFEFPFKVVYPPEFDQGNLREKFDVIVFVDGALGGGRGFGAIRPDVVREAPAGGDAPPTATGAEANIPEEFRGRRGGITKDKTAPHLKKFLEEGGTILAVGSSTALAGQLDLPLKSHLMTKDDKGEEKSLGRDKFYVPGSVLQIRVDSAHPLAWGIDDFVDVMFSSNPVFRIPDDEKEAKGFKRIAWFNDKTPLRSGWAWGQEHLEGGVTIAAAPVGKGQLVLCGPQILFRGQPHGTFKFLFNAIVGAGGDTLRTSAKDPQ
jgi:Zinc carboxypeptidase